VLKLLKMAKSVRALLDTVMQALPEVGNLGLLFFLLFFIFAALGVELFGRIGQIADFILTSGQRVLTKGRIALPDCPFSRGVRVPSFRPIRGSLVHVYALNGISIGSAVLAQLACMHTHKQTIKHRQQ